MNRRSIDKLWLTALLSACALGFFPSQAALSEEPSALRRRPPRDDQRLFSYDFVDADVVYVVKVLAKDLRRNVYIGPGVEGSVTAKFDSVTAMAALEWVLKQQAHGVDFKLIGYNTLVVASPDKIDQIVNDISGKSFEPRRPRANIRQEFLLEHASALDLMAQLKDRYEKVEFIPHPTMNGFYAVGSRSDILRLKTDVPRLDREK